MEDLQIVEHIVRKDPKVIEQCVLSGIPREDMHKVYCDREFGIAKGLLIDLLTVSLKPGQLVSMSDLATKFDFSKH
jgi:hypothetical protein